MFLQLAKAGQCRKLDRYHPIRVNRSFAFDLSKVKDFTQGILVISIRMN